VLVCVTALVWLLLLLSAVHWQLPSSRAICCSALFACDLHLASRKKSIDLVARQILHACGGD
jgi:hypothetical protein